MPTGPEQFREEIPQPRLKSGPGKLSHKSIAGYFLLSQSLLQQTSAGPGYWYDFCKILVTHTAALVHTLNNLFVF